MSTRDKLAKVLDAHLTESDYESGCPLSCGYAGDDRAEHIANALMPLVDEHYKAGRKAALDEVAQAWQWGAWTMLTSVVKTRNVLGAAQVVTDWLRHRAAREAS